MALRALMVAAVLAGLAASPAVAFADDPTSALLQMRGMAPQYPGPGPLPASNEGGPCYQGMHSVARFNGYRCVRDQ
jgi:hypothetical protein